MPVVDGRVCALPVQRTSLSASEAAPSARRTDLSRFATGVRAECGPVSVDHGRTSAAGIPSSPQHSSCRERLGSEPIDPTHDLGEQNSGHQRQDHHHHVLGHAASDGGGGGGADPQAGTADWTGFVLISLTSQPRDPTEGRMATPTTADLAYHQQIMLDVWERHLQAEFADHRRRHARCAPRAGSLGWTPGEVAID